MAYVKKYKTEEERRKAKAEGARKAVKARIAAGNNRGGRPKLTGPSQRVPTQNIGMRVPDYQVFVKLAHATGKTLVDLMHDVAEGLKAKNAALFEAAEPKIEV